jgi:hypothetical protein
MPVKVALSPGKYEFIYPTTEWKSSPCKLKKKAELPVDENFYFYTKAL